MSNKIFLYLSLALFLSSCMDDEINLPPEENPLAKYFYNDIKTIQYRTDVSDTNLDLLSYDVYYNDSLPALKPVIIWVHGGGWAIGDKTTNMEDKIKYFESLGYVLVSVNYRLSPTDEDGVPNDLLNSDRIKFPTHPQDVASAINHIYNNIESYGGDINRMVIMGHSAGAHLSMLVATNPQYLTTYGLSPKNIFKGVASFDTEGYDVTQHFLDFGINSSNDKLDLEVNNFLDNDPTTLYHTTVITYLNAFGKNETTWKNASPINYISEVEKPQKYFFYYQDLATSNQNRINLIEGFINALDDGINEVISKDTPYNHATINQRIGQDNQMTDELTDFLSNCLD